MHFALKQGICIGTPWSASLQNSGHFWNVDWGSTPMKGVQSGSLSGVQYGPPRAYNPCTGVPKRSKSFILLSGNCSSPRQNFVLVISSICPVLNWWWSEIWIKLRKWSASLHFALQSISLSWVLSGLLQSTIQKMDWIDKWIALQKQLWIWIVDCTPKMPECQMPWLAPALEYAPLMALAPSISGRASCTDLKI